VHGSSKTARDAAAGAAVRPAGRSLSSSNNEEASLLPLLVAVSSVLERTWRLLVSPTGSKSQSLFVSIQGTVRRVRIYSASWLIEKTVMDHPKNLTHPTAKKSIVIDPC
jgi:hypothetical protein